MIFTRNILNWETFNPYFRWSEILGKFETHGEEFVFYGESLELFETLIRFCGKICCWENLELVNLNANFQNFCWEILLGISLPK